MPKFIEQADIKSLFIWLFSTNIALILVIISMAVYIRNADIERLDNKLAEGEAERKEFRTDLTNLKIKVAKNHPKDDS